jgi:hypothetical protein
MGDCGQKRKYVQIQAQTAFYSGPSETVRYQRGKTFPTRDAAIAYAQKVIDAGTLSGWGLLAVS